MFIRKGQLPIFIANLLILAGFASYYISRLNYEFILYIGVIIFFIAAIIATNHKIYYPNFVLWGLTLWALMHMAGGSLHINGVLLYRIMIVRLSETIPAFRFDQLVHIIGFGVATMTLYYVLKPLLRPDSKSIWALSIILVCAGLGIGSLNEIIEFIATLLAPRTGVGGYLNTALDLCANLIGAVIAVTVIMLKERLFPQNQLF